MGKLSTLLIAALLLGCPALGASGPQSPIKGGSLPASSIICTDASSNLTGACSAAQNLVTATSVTANATVGTLPANATILYAIARETAGHGVTISLGATSGATDVVNSVALTASTSTIIPITSFSNAWFSSGATQSIFIDSASWNSASVNITVYYIVGP